MPKIISYTPSWLSRPSPGFQIFTSSHSRPNSRGVDGQGPKARQNGGTTGERYGGPKRTIATRGIEIFVVIDNEIRWTELCMLRDGWEEQQKSKTYPNEDSERSGSPALEQDLLTKHSYRV
jgi:nucleoporin NUP82